MTSAKEVVAFWVEAGPKRWFAKDAAFDAAFRERFLATHEEAAAGRLDSWAETAEGALALLILLDQFPRNSFRSTPRMFATDDKGREVAAQAIAMGHDKETAQELRVFFYLPFEHSERLEDQEKAIELVRTIGGENFRYAEIHRDVIARFGRFPHRNAILGRPSTPGEEAFLASGGFAG